ncbi:DUF6093 family protein [Micromonospora sp. WMMD1102]|uniref:DUF6093 family protein n=1 Tax=Micromonospora sp. WMMD1102 TaxID=3016105 RepID=UPI002414E6A7|nr:DUF6093 family protein [Micromonospora sp. WMMD1102]MDG4792008.1 DUF6093 family protein [Micromonospora sp. WMMD1102]
MALTGRPGLRATHVVPGAWQHHHRPVSDDGMPDECLIVRPTSSGRAWNDTTGRSEYPTPPTVYDGPCRLTRGGTGSMPAGTQVTVGRATTLSDYTLVIRTDSDLVQVGDIAEMRQCGGDPGLVGQRLRVKNALRGSYTWERLLSCELEPPTTR